VVKGLAKMPDNTVIDGEVIAFDDEGRPSFKALQNYGSAPAPVIYYVFDVMVLAGQFEFLEWTGDNHLRHSKFVGLREDKKSTDVVRE